MPTSELTLADLDRLMADNERLVDENDKLREVLNQYANPDNWRLNARFDPNSPRFDGIKFASEAMTTEG